MVMKRFQLIAVIILSVTLTYGCAGFPPAEQSSSTKLVLAGPVWILAGYQRESGFLPIEPGHGSAARIIFRENGTFEATTGWSVFSGTWKASNNSTANTSSAKFYPSAFKSDAPDLAGEQFEEDIIRALRNTRSIQKKVAALRFLDASGTPLLDFISLRPER